MTAITTLTRALESKLTPVDEEDSPAKQMGLDKFPNTFQLNWDQKVEKNELLSQDKYLKTMQESYNMTMLLQSQKRGQVHEQIRSKALANVYRQKYAIPEDLRVRKPDRDMREVLASSQTVEKVRHMAETSIHPALIFIDKDLNDS